MEKGRNVGVRLTESDVILDVDPKNFEDGDNPLERFKKDTGLRIGLYPTVVTGSGGLHVYMKKPENVSIRDSLADYRGLEFKSKGRQMVAPGSIHPGTLRTYEWDEFGPTLTDGVPDAPALMLNVIRRPLGSQATGGGEISAEQLSEMLEALEVGDFRDQTAWLELMMASHHATAGDGRDEFIEWSTGDPDYQDEGTNIGLRWDSLHNDRDAAITFRTLFKAVSDAGRVDLLPRRSAVDDFQDDELDEGVDEEVPEHERKGPLEKLNDTYTTVMDGSKFRVVWQEVDPTQNPPRAFWTKAHKQDFSDMLAHRKIAQEDGKPVPLAKAWLEWPGRNHAKGMIFDPERDHKGYLNMWKGWAFQPVKREGAWSLLDSLLHDVLCDGDSDLYEFMLNWAAYMVQHPGSPAEVAICFRGGKGVGKGTFGRALARIAGRHGMHITSSEHLTGRFNDHLRDTIFLFADEALKPYDKEGESRLKGLITEPTLLFEGKGRDPIQDKNRLHVMMASNEDWFVPAGPDGERRFVVADANTSWQGNHALFSKLNAQMNNGGNEALLWDLLQRDIVGWTPRENMPVSAALVDQKMRNLDPVGQWWMHCLQEGAFATAETYKPEEPWDEESQYFGADELQRDFENFAKRAGVRSPLGMGRANTKIFFGELRKYTEVSNRTTMKPSDEWSGVSTRSDGRVNAYLIPTLVECRERFELMIGGDIDWETD